MGCGHGGVKAKPDVDDSPRSQDSIQPSPWHAILALDGRLNGG